MMDDGWSLWWVVPMIVCALVFIAAVIAVLVAVTRSGVLPHERTPEEVLRDRFARGEIDSVEYRDRLDALREHISATNP